MQSTYLCFHSWGFYWRIALCSLLPLSAMHEDYFSDKIKIGLNHCVWFDVNLVSLHSCRSASILGQACITFNKQTEG